MSRQAWHWKSLPRSNCFFNVWRECRIEWVNGEEIVESCGRVVGDEKRGESDELVNGGIPKD